MADLHISRELLRAVSNGELSPRLLLEIGLQHLTTLCPHCRRELEAWKQERGSTPYDYTQAYQGLPDLMSDRRLQMAEERRSAERDLRALLRLPIQEREARVKRARSRFRGVALAQLLLEESRKLFIKEPGAAFRLAELARTVVHHSPNAPGVFDYIALSTAYMANAARASGELRKAAEHFSHARYIARQQGVTDPEVLARIDDLEGSLCKDQRLFEEAEVLLRRAARLYRLVGSAVDQARVLVKLADTFDLQDRTDAAIRTIETALRSLTPEGNLRLYVCARFNLAWYLTTRHQYQEAEKLLFDDYPLYGRLREPWTQLRLTWLRGRIDAGRGKTEAAERAFLEARDGFIAQGIGYDAAMISVEEIAPLYLKQGRAAEVKRLAEEMLPVFAAADVHREALAALLTFVEAAKHERLSATLARDIGRYLRDARADPSLRFSNERPS